MPLLRANVQRGNVLSTTRINEAEMLVGLYRAGDYAGRIEKLRQLLSTLVMLEFTAESAEQFGRTKADLLRTGELIGDADTMIAAIALVHGEPVLTRNARHFQRIRGLEVESY